MVTKRFIIKVLTFVAIIIGVNALLLWGVPKDKNAYLNEYNHKIVLLETMPQPRIIFLGGSNIAFGIDSRTISDSLHYHAINMGLHGGIGMRYPVEDCLQYIQRGDVVVMQLEYGNFFNGGNGNHETFAAFMMATGWRNATRLNAAQWGNVLAGIPREAVRNALRVMRYPMRHTMDSRASETKFEYVKDGFNGFGDEVSHLDYPGEPCVPSNQAETREVDREVVAWLQKWIEKYEQAGAIVLMVPPVNVESNLKATYNDNIARALEDIGHPYLVTPESMALNDSCYFNTGYHMNRDGVKQNTRHLIDLIRKHKPQ